MKRMGDLEAPRAIRRCQFCGEEWPLFTPHLCEEEREVAHPESLANLIQDCIQDMGVYVKTTAGEVDIGASIAYLLAVRLADELFLRRISLMGALVRDDVLQVDNKGWISDAPLFWRWADE
jgi:hypothetical protein